MCLLVRRFPIHPPLCRDQVSRATSKASMDYTDEQKMAHLLDEDPSLRIFWSEHPRCILVPATKARKEFFASVVVFLNPGAVNLETIAFILSKVVELLRSSELLGGLTGVEVVPCIREGAKSVRLLRLSVRHHALEVASRLEPSDLLKQKPADCVTCGWYVSPPAT